MPMIDNVNQEAANNYLKSKKLPELVSDNVQPLQTIEECNTTSPLFDAQEKESFDRNKSDSNGLTGENSNRTKVEEAGASNAREINKNKASILSQSKSHNVVTLQRGDTCNSSTSSIQSNIPHQSSKKCFGSTSQSMGSSGQQSSSVSSYHYLDNSNNCILEHDDEAEEEQLRTNQRQRGFLGTSLTPSNPQSLPPSAHSPHPSISPTPSYCNPNTSTHFSTHGSSLLPGNPHPVSTSPHSIGSFQGLGGYGGSNPLGGSTFNGDLTPRSGLSRGDLGDEKSPKSSISHLSLLSASFPCSSLASSLSDVTSEAVQLEAAIRNNDTYQVKRLLDMHPDTFQMDPTGSIQEKSSNDSRSCQPMQQNEATPHSVQTSNTPGLSGNNNVIPGLGTNYSSDFIAARKYQLGGLSGGMDNRSDPRSDGSSSGELEVPLVFANAVHIAIDCDAADVLRLLLRYGVPPDRPGLPGASCINITTSNPQQVKSTRPSPKVSPTGHFLEKKASLTTTGLSTSPRYSPRASPRGSPKCSPRSGSPRPLSPLAGGGERVSPYGGAFGSENDRRLRPALVRQAGSEALEERTRDMKLNLMNGGRRNIGKNFGVEGSDRGAFKTSPLGASADLKAEFEERKMRYRQEEEHRKKLIMNVNYDDEVRKREMANEKLKRDIEEAMRIRDMDEKRQEEEGKKSKEEECRYVRDYDELESISEVQSTIPEDPSLEDEETNQDAEKKEGEDKKAVSRRVSWVPEVAEKMPVSGREKPAYKRRHSAIVRRAVVTFQRQRSFSLDSQQQQVVRESDGVVSEGPTMRLVESRGERNRSEPRYFTFTQGPWEKETKNQAHRSYSSRFNSQVPTAGEGSAKLLTLCTSIASEAVTVDYDGVKTFAEVYTRDHLYALPPLFLAAVKANTAIMYLLLKYGAPATVVDQLGNTPLHLASCQRTINWESVLDLLEFGASITHRNCMGKRALDLQPSLVKLQEQLVYDCFTVFEPPNKPEPEPDVMSAKDNVPTPKQPSSIFKRLQGVASRDKNSPVFVSTSSSKSRSALHATNSGTGSIVGSIPGGSVSRGAVTAGTVVGATVTTAVSAGSGGTSRDTDSMSLGSNDAVLHPTDSVRSRNSGMQDLRSKELTLESLNQLGSRRRLRKLHEEGMDPNRTPPDMPPADGSSSDSTNNTVAEVERNLALLKKLSSNPECLGLIVRVLQMQVPTLVLFYARNPDTSLYVSLSSLLHHILKNCLDMFSPPAESTTRPSSVNEDYTTIPNTQPNTSTGLNQSSHHHEHTIHTATPSPNTYLQAQSPVMGRSSSSNSSFVESSRLQHQLSLATTHQRSSNICLANQMSVPSSRYSTSGYQHTNLVSGQNTMPYTILSSSSSSSFNNQLQQSLMAPNAGQLQSTAHISGSGTASTLTPQTSQMPSYQSSCRQKSSKSSRSRHQSPGRSQQANSGRANQVSLQWKRKEAAAAICILVRACAALLAGVQELQFTAMTTLNKIIDAAIVYRIGDLVICQDKHLLAPDAEKTRLSPDGSQSLYEDHSKSCGMLSRSVSMRQAAGGGRPSHRGPPNEGRPSALCTGPSSRRKSTFLASATESDTRKPVESNVVPGRGALGHYGMWRQMWRNQSTRHEPPGAASGPNNKESGVPAADVAVDTSGNTSIIGSLANISAVTILNVMHNAITLHKRTIGARHLCTPSVRWRHCRSHCLQILSARVLLFMTHCPAIQRQLMEPNRLKSLVSALDSTHDPQLLCLVNQVVATLALDPMKHRSLLEANVPDALTQLILPSDEWYYTNHSTRHARYVKHHAARVLVYLGLQHRVQRRVNIYDLLLDEAPPPTPLAECSVEDSYISLTSAPPCVVTGNRGKSVLAMSVEGLVLQTLQAMEPASSKEEGDQGAEHCSNHGAHKGGQPTGCAANPNTSSLETKFLPSNCCSHFQNDPHNLTTSTTSSTTSTTLLPSASMDCYSARGATSQSSSSPLNNWGRVAAQHSELGKENRGNHTNGGSVCGGQSSVEKIRKSWGPQQSKAQAFPFNVTNETLGDQTTCSMGLPPGVMGQRLISCLMMGLPMVLHPVIFLRLLLHRLLSSMHHLTKWKSCASRSSWASQSENWRGRVPSTEADTPTLSKRRRVNLTLDFAEKRSDEGGGGSPTDRAKIRKVGRLESRGSKEKDEEAKNVSKSISNVFSKSGKQRQNSFNNSIQQISQKNETPTATTERVWKLRETFAAFSTKDVSDTISHFLPSVLRSSDSHQSMSTSSRSPSPPTNAVVSPPIQRTKTFRFKNQVLSRSAAENTSSDSTPVHVANDSKDLDSCEEYINAFQKQLQNLPSYERTDYIPPSTNLRPRSRSVPRVTYTSMSSLSVPVTRSPSLTPELARGTEFGDGGTYYYSHRIMGHPHLTAAYSASHLLTTPHTIAASTPLMSPGHSMKLPLRNPLSMSNNSVSKSGGGPPVQQCSSPYLSPHTSPRSPHASPRLLSPALSPITPPKFSHDDLHSSASSTVTPNPYRRVAESPVYIVVEMPPVHRAVLSCVEEWLQSGGVSIDVNSSVGQELNNFLARVGQCGPPYQQWCENIKQHWNISESDGVTDEEETVEQTNIEYSMLQQLVVSGELACSKEEAASLACIQLRIEETANPMGTNPTLSVQSPPHQSAYNPSSTITTPTNTPAHHSTLGVPVVSIRKRGSISAPFTPSASTPTGLTPKGSTINLAGHSPICSPLLPSHIHHRVSTLPIHLQQSSTNLLTGANLLPPSSGGPFSFTSPLTGTFNSTLVNTLSRRSFSAASGSNLLTVPTSPMVPNMQPRGSIQLSIPLTPESRRHTICTSDDDDSSFPQFFSPAKRISIALPSPESIVGGAGELFKGCYGALDPHKRAAAQQGLMMQSCLPPEYWRGKNILRLIKEQKRKLFHAPVYDSELALKKLYIHTCKRLPAYSCRLHHVKELLTTKTKKKASRLLGIGISSVVLLDTKTKILSKSQATQDLLQWRTGGGRSHDRLVLEFRGTKWTFSVNSASSLSELGRALWTTLQSEDRLGLSSAVAPYGTSGGGGTVPGSQTATPIGRASSGSITEVGRRVAPTSSPLGHPMLYSEELERLQKLLHFPEEVALQLTEVEYDLFYRVAPIAYIRHVTTDLRGDGESIFPGDFGPTCAPSGGVGAEETTEAPTVKHLIRRFNEVSSWITHVIVSQPTHEERKAVLSCIVRAALSCWNLGNFNSAMEIITGLKSEKLKPFWLSLENEHLPTLDFLTSALLGNNSVSPHEEALGTYYQEALDKALLMPQCPVVPFFGAFLQDLNKILSSSPSLVVLTHDGHELQFIADYCGEDSFFTRVGPGGLINMTKLYETQAVVDQIAAFHSHYIDRTRILQQTNLNNNVFLQPTVSVTVGGVPSKATGGVVPSVTIGINKPTPAPPSVSASDYCGMASSGNSHLRRGLHVGVEGTTFWPRPGVGSVPYWAGIYTAQPLKGIVHNIPQVFTTAAMNGSTSGSNLTAEETQSPFQRQNTSGSPGGTIVDETPYWMQFLGEELESYTPVQPLINDHGVTLLPMDPSERGFNLHTLQLLHHGSSLVHWDVETGRSSLVFVRLERSNGTLTWSRPPWSALKAGTHSSSSAPTDFVLGGNPEELVSPGLMLMYAMTPEPTGGSPEEGYLQISCMKDVYLGYRDTNIVNMARRYFPDTPGLPSSSMCCVSIVYGSCLADNRIMLLMAPPALANAWCQGLGMVLRAQRSLHEVKDKRLYWLKEQYLRLFFDEENCCGPKPAEAIKIFGGRNWTNSTAGSMSPQEPGISKRHHGSTRLRKPKSQLQTKGDGNTSPITSSRRTILTPAPACSLLNNTCQPHNLSTTTISSSSSASTILHQPSPPTVHKHGGDMSPTIGADGGNTFNAPTASSIPGVRSYDHTPTGGLGSPRHNRRSFRERSRSGGPLDFSDHRSAPSSGLKNNEPLTQAAELNFSDFVALYKSFSLRARKDLRELFKKYAVTRKSLSDSSLDEQTSVSSPPTPPYTKLGSSNSAHNLPSASLHRRNQQFKSQGILTRNSSLDLLVFRNNCQKKKIFDVIAFASIVTNCAGEAGSKTLVMTLVEMRKFLEEQQGEVHNDADIEELLERHEPDPNLRALGIMSFEGFARMLMDEDNYAFQEIEREPDEMSSHPLSHFYIASSHNTYLTGHQLKGESSVELYSQVLQTGCRCVELDCYDGDDGSPMIYHGHTFTTKIPFRNVVECIDRSAFLTSPYPVILSLENHCSLQQQAKMAAIFLEIFGDKLINKFMFESDFNEDVHLPSPQQMLYKIIIKNKKLPSDHGTSSSSVTYSRGSGGGSVGGASGGILTPHQSAGGSTGRTNSLISNASTGSINENDSDDEYNDSEEEDDDDQNPFEIPSNSQNYEDERLKIDSKGLYHTSSETSKQSSKQKSNDTSYPSDIETMIIDESSKQKKSSQIAKELSDLVNYCQAVKFQSFNIPSPRESVRKKTISKKIAGQGSNITTTPIMSHSQNNADVSRMMDGSLQPAVFKRSIGTHICYQCSSVNEKFAKKLLRRHGIMCIRHTEMQLMRTYPAGTRIDSSNFNPLFFWAFGFQMTALNYQTDDTYLHLNYALFEQNGSIGYVLKPRVLWDKNHMMYRRFHAFQKEFDGLHVLNMKISIISGQYVCLNHFQGSPQIEIELVGIPVDCVKFKTKVIQRNSFNPIWNDSFNIRIMFKDLAFLKFTVTDTATNHVTAQRIISVNCLRRGYRHLRLRNLQNQPLPVSTLFIYSLLEEEEYEIRPARVHDSKNLESSEANQSIDITPNVLLKRRKFFMRIYQVVPEEPCTIISVTQDCTTRDCILRAISKIENPLDPDEYLLIEEVARGWKKGDKISMQRILDMNESPLIAQANWKGDGKFIMKKKSNDPSTRAWFTTIMSTASKRDSDINSDDETRGWEEDSNFLVCVHNVSGQIPYTILKAPMSSTTQDIIAQALVKARRMEDPSHFVLVEELEFCQTKNDSSMSSSKGKSRIEKRILDDDENVYKLQAGWKTLGKLVLRDRNVPLEKERSRATAAAAAVGSTLSTAISKVSRGRQQARRPVKETYSDPSTLATSRATGFPDRRIKSLYDTIRVSGNIQNQTSNVGSRGATSALTVRSDGEMLSDDEGHGSDLRTAVQKLKKVSLKKIQKVWR